MNITLLFAGLYVSEGWYELYRNTGSVYARTRAVVLFDRVINNQIDIAKQLAIEENNS